MLLPEDLTRIETEIREITTPIQEALDKIIVQRVEICRKLAEIDLRVKDLEP